MYKVDFDAGKIKKSLKKLSVAEREKIIRKVDAKLRSYHPLMKCIKKVVNTDNIYRIRIGDYRALFSKNSKKKLITVILIEKRDTVYKDKS